MRRRVLLGFIVAAIAFTPAAAVAQVDFEEDEIEFPGDSTSGRTERTPRQPGTGRIPGTGRTPGTERIPGTGRTPGTGRVAGTDRPQRLPVTGSTAETIALDGITLLGAGLVINRFRRRLAHIA